MSFKSNFPESSHIPVVQVAVNKFSSSTEPMLDLLNADHVKMFGGVSNVTLPFSTYSVTVGSQGRLDLVDYINNGKVELWWLIGYINGIINPIFDLTVDKDIKIPAVGSLHAALQAAATLTTKTVDIP